MLEHIQANRGFGFVVPDDKKMNMDIFVAKEDSLGAVDGHKVVVEITDWPDDSKICNRNDYENFRS